MNSRISSFSFVALLAALNAAAPANAQDTAGSVEINGVAGYIEIRTSRGAPLRAQITAGRKLSALSSLDDGTLTINGRVGSNARSTCTMIGPPNARIEQTIINGAVYNPEDLPRIVITGSETLTLSINGSVLRGVVGNIDSVSIQQNGCSLLTIGNVAGDVEINVSGSGKTSFGRIGGKTDINIAGSGDVDVGAVGELVEINIQGSGNVDLKAGRSALLVNIAGSGSVRHGGTVIDPEVNIAGSGNVNVSRVEGDAEVSKSGSGTFRVR